MRTIVGLLSRRAHCSPVSRVISSGMLMEVAQVPPSNVILGCAMEDYVPGWRGLDWTLQALYLQWDGGGWLCMAQCHLHLSGN